MSVGFLKRLRIIHPHATFHLVCQAQIGIGNLFLKLNLVNKVHEVRKKNQASYQKVLNQLNSLHFKAIYCLHQSFRSACFVHKLKSKRKIGFQKWWNFWVFHERVSYNKSLPEPLRQMSLLSVVDPEIKKSFKPLLSQNCTSDAMSEELRQTALDGLSLSLKSFLLKKEGEIKKERIIFMAPGSLWPTKRWTNEGFIQLGQRLSKEKWLVFLVGSSKEQEELQHLSDNIPGSQNWAGKTDLYQTLCLFLKGSALIAHDSGASHLATLVELPTVSLFGPTVLKFGWRPWQKNSIVVEKKLPCRPCSKHGPIICPLGTHDCMKSIQEKEVYNALMSLLSIESSL